MTFFQQNCDSEGCQVLHDVSKVEGPLWFFWVHWVGGVPG